MKTTSIIITAMALVIGLSGCERGKSKLDRPINTIKNNCTTKQAKQGLCVKNR